MRDSTKRLLKGLSSSLLAIPIVIFVRFACCSNSWIPIGLFLQIVGVAFVSVWVIGGGILGWQRVLKKGLIYMEALLFIIGFCLIESGLAIQLLKYI